MGVWNAHTSLGNILGSLIAGYYVESDWGASFAVPGMLLIVGAALVYTTVVDHPSALANLSPQGPDDPGALPTVEVCS